MRLIDADELKESMEEHTDYKGYLVCDPEEIIDLAPTVEERPHGVWIEKSQFDRLCKNCGQQHIGVKRFANFCPNCGSDNRKKEGE